jgi:hypothetical protein
MRLTLLSMLLLATGCDPTTRVTKGEVRGIPEAATAYTQVLVLLHDTVAALVRAACGTLADSLARSSRPTVPDVWTVMEAETRTAVNDRCRTENPQDPDAKESCILNEMIEARMLLDLAKDPIPGLDGENRRRVLAMQAAVAKRRAQLADAAERANADTATALTRGAEDRLLAALLQRDTVRRALDRAGRFRLAKPAPGADVVILVRRPGSTEVAHIPVRTDDDLVIPYDTTTFRPLLLCSP